MTSSESEGQFEGLINDLKDKVISMEILEGSDSYYKQDTEGASSDQYDLIRSITESDTLKIVQNIKYDNLKYMFLKNIGDEGKPPVYLYISTDVDQNNMKRGMFITAFYCYSLVFTFDFKKLNNTTAKIINILDQYQAEE
ncbi:uncharacterized protein VNE69_02080 [Vairimorpha necatrix]|uniref:ADF-H domain-containing protein n=1 Tax=Vairimorpha necatrix TaxID=6039 RepID=A0AAX4J9C6_9MICR